MRRPHAGDFLFALTFSGCIIAAAPAAAPSAQSSDLPPTAASADDSARLISEVGSRYTTHTTDHFTVVSATDQAWADYTGKLLERTHANFYKTFKDAGFTPSPIDQRLVWVCFSKRSEFDDYALKADRMDMSWSKGYYSTRTNRVALLQRSAPGMHTVKSGADNAAAAPTGVYQNFKSPKAGSSDPFIDVANATHEAAHQLAFNSGLQKRGVMYPLWASEGMAANFEVDDIHHFQLGGDNASRKRDLAEACREGRLYNLDEFVTLSRLPFGNQQLIHDIYAQAWGFFRFLITERHEELKKYLAAVARLEPGRRDNSTLRAEFVLAFGSVTGLEKDWRAYLNDLAADTH